MTAVQPGAETAIAAHPSGEQIELAHGDQRAVVVEVGGALRCYTAGGLDVVDGYGADDLCSGARGQTFVPWPNRLRDGAYDFAGSRHQLPLSEPAKRNAIHGLVRWQAFRMRTRTASAVTLAHRLHPRPGYPFALQVVIEYELSAAGLRVRTNATNIGRAACPYGTGAHPYLTVGTPLVDEAVLRCPGRRWMRSDDRAIPIDDEPVAGTPYDFRSARRVGDVELDTGFCDLERDEAGVARVELSGDDGRQTTLWLGPAYRYLMLFTGDSLPEPGRRRRSLGVEPMTCAPNALQSGAGLCVLQPGESHAAEWGIEPR